jgi:nitroreductase
MNVIEAIAARRTVRDFAPRQVERSTLLGLLDAGLKAPSHNHLREWRFVVVEDAETRERLARFFVKAQSRREIEETLDVWEVSDRSQRAMYLDAIPKQAQMIVGAGALVIPAFRQRTPILAEKRGLHEFNAFASMWAVLENILIAAASEGIFGVTKIVSSPDETGHVRETLGIPDDYEIPCYLALGYPAEDAVWLEQVPVAVSERVSIDHWENPLASPEAGPERKTA